MIFKNKYLISTVVCMIFLITLSACDEPLLDEFKSEKGVELSDLDDVVCAFFSKDSTKADTVIVGSDTSYITTKMYIPVNAATLKQPVLIKWINSSDSLITEKLDKLQTDTLLIVDNSLEQDTTYVCFLQSTEDVDKTYFYVSWDLNKDNIDAYVEIDIFNGAGEKVELLSTDMSLESIAGCTNEIELGEKTETVPRVRARYLFELTEEKYLVRFYVTEPQSVNRVKLVILKQFLSI